MAYSGITQDQVIAMVENCPFGDPVIQKSMDYVRNHYMTEITLDTASKQVSLCRVYFCAYFKRVTGINFFTVLSVYRIHIAKQLLCSQVPKISAVAEQVGYKSLPHFYRLFQKETGLTPSQYRQKFRASQ